MISSNNIKSGNTKKRESPNENKFKSSLNTQGETIDALAINQNSLMSNVHNNASVD